MTEVSADELRKSVEALHGCQARFRIVVPVIERFNDRVVWDGTVHVFDLEGHPSAKTCFAWSSPVEDSDRRRFYAVLQESPINSAVDAVRASIINDHRSGKTDAET